MKISLRLIFIEKKKYNFQKTFLNLIIDYEIFYIRYARY